MRLCYDPAFPFFHTRRQLIDILLKEKLWGGFVLLYGNRAGSARIDKVTHFPWERVQYGVSGVKN